MSSLTRRDLFGGAITADASPSLVDVSDIRQVPDTQEVFLYPNSNASIITEILEKVDASKPEDIIKYHFDSLAHDNEARSSKVKSIVTLANERRDGTPSSIVLKGEQYVPKFNKTALDRVEILMAVFRVEDKATDVVVTFNVPLEAADGGSVSGSELPKFESDFEAFIKSFRIVDFGLFA